jgi:hypothetical protein
VGGSNGKNQGNGVVTINVLLAVPGNDLMLIPNVK